MTFDKGVEPGRQPFWQTQPDLEVQPNVGDTGKQVYDLAVQCNGPTTLRRVVESLAKLYAERVKLKQCLLKALDDLSQSLARRAVVLAMQAVTQRSRAEADRLSCPDVAGHVDQGQEDQSIRLS